MAMVPRKDSAREVANKERACVWQLAAALLLGFVPESESARLTNLAREFIIARLARDDISIAQTAALGPRELRARAA